ncbi:MAG: MBL fold metallo-hydrolase, partial [Clostridia bacterium]|nr:MBL fold metallo-hydrolase [Clostridia bacterium]
MIKFCSLYSGSQGNCIFLGTDHTKILIDAGVNAKHIQQGLQAIGENPKAINAILLTHEHKDHIQGAGVFARRYQVPIYATHKTWQAITSCIGPLFNTQRCEIDPHDRPLQFNDLQIQSFSISHDAADPVAYTIFAEDRQISIVTDLGLISPEIRAFVHGSDAILL